jgi:hypothetical protein
LFKKILILVAVFIIYLFLIIPSGGNPADVVLDEQIELLIPGVFQQVDSGQDQKAEALKFMVEVLAYREGDFIVTGNLEGKQGDQWLAIATTVMPFLWTPENNKIELTFPTGNIVKYKISGPYRVIITIRSGDWELPARVAGFSPAYTWKDFRKTERITSGEITTGSQAKRAAEIWAEFKTIKLIRLKEINFDYDHWQVDFQGVNGDTLRFLVSPEGTVDLRKIIKN